MAIYRSSNAVMYCTMINRQKVGHHCIGKMCVFTVSVDGTLLGKYIKLARAILKG